MKVVGNTKFSLYINQDDHSPPHCHVRYKDKDISVQLPLITPMYGQKLPNEAKLMIENNLDVLCDVWDSLHPKKRPESKNK